MSRADSFCTFTLDTHEPVHIPDARDDPRFADNPHTTGELASIRYYGAHPLRTPGGVVIGTLCVYDEEVRPVVSETAVDLAMLADRVVDVLELELASRRLTEVNDRLERSNARLEAFAGQVSHDLKNPLTSLSLSLEMLETEVDEQSDAQTTIARARRATARMDELIDHLLEFASTGDTPRQEPVDLGAEVAAVIDDMGAWRDTADITRRCAAARDRRPVPAALGHAEPHRQRGEVHGPPVVPRSSPSPPSRSRVRTGSRWPIVAPASPTSTASTSSRPSPGSTARCPASASASRRPSGSWRPTAAGSASTRAKVAARSSGWSCRRPAG